VGGPLQRFFTSGLPTAIEAPNATARSSEGRLTVVFDHVGYKELMEDTVVDEDLLRTVEPR
jgi:hypothetical protein